MLLVVDTHALVWFLGGSDRLSESAKAALQDPNAEIILPAIILAEIAFLFNKNRIPVDLPTVNGYIAQAQNCTIYPLDEMVLSQLPLNLDIHDALEVATALVFRNIMGKDVAVVTKDREISGSGIIRALW